MIVDRKTFYAIMVYEGGLDPNIVFMPETDPHLNPKKRNPAKWFLICPSIFLLYPKSKKFWDWCDKHCQGAVYCYSESDTEQWWGFENKDDIILWSLKWL